MGVRASPPRHGFDALAGRPCPAIARYASVGGYGGPASRTSGGSLALRVRHRSPAPLPRFSVRPFQAPHVSRRRDQCAQCGALIALPADNTKRKRFASPGRPLPRKGVAVVQAGLSVSHYVRPTRRFSRRSSSPSALRTSARQVPLLVGTTASREPPVRSARPVRRAHRTDRRQILRSGAVMPRAGRSHGARQRLRCRCAPTAHPNQERAGRPVHHAVSPLSFPPLDTPRSSSPLSNSNPPKGGNRRGHRRGGRSRRG